MTHPRFPVEKWTDGSFLAVRKSRLVVEGMFTFD